MNPIELGKFIATLRNEKDLTQEELAEKLFIDKRKVSRWECGTSVPEFDMLIKLSQILDVSLYELSICKRIENPKLRNRITNKFKTIKDFKNYKMKKIICIILLVVVVVFSIITTIYTFKNSGTVKIYDLKSIDDKYKINGYFMIINNNYYYTINNIQYIGDSEQTINYDISNCNYEIYNQYNKRIIYVMNNNDCSGNLNCIIDYRVISADGHKSIKNEMEYEIRTNCKDNGSDSITLKFKTQEKYNNSLFSQTNKYQ